MDKARAIELAEKYDWQWVRYRFYTKSVDDPRPLIYNPMYPWWCSGYAGDMSYAVVVAYLPKYEPLARYWDDAFEVESEPKKEIEFSSRFPQPDGFVTA